MCRCWMRFLLFALWTGGCCPPPHAASTCGCTYAIFSPFATFIFLFRKHLMQQTQQLCLSLLLDWSSFECACLLFLHDFNDTRKWLVWTARLVRTTVFSMNDTAFPVHTTGHVCRRPRMHNVESLFRS